MGWSQKIPQWLGIFTDIAWKSHCGRNGVWACHSVGAPLPSPHTCFGWGGKKLTLLTTSGKNWAYAFVWLTGDAQHVPLPEEGHVRTMVKGSPSRNTCSHLIQLEVHLLFQLDNWVVYPEGLNGGLEPVVTPLPESLACGMSVLDKPTFLQVDLSQFTTGDSVPKASAPCQASTLTSPTHFTMEDPPKAESQINMTTEVQDLLSCTVLGTFSQVSGSSTPESLTSVALGDPSSPRVGDHAWYHWSNWPNYPANQNSWGWHRLPPRGSDFTPRGNEQNNGAPTGN